MSRAPAAFRQSDLTKAVKALRKGGLKVFRTEITAQGISLIHEQDVTAEAPEAALDAWLAKRGRNARPS